MLIYVNKLQICVDIKNSRNIFEQFQKLVNFAFLRNKIIFDFDANIGIMNTVIHTFQC